MVEAGLVFKGTRRRSPQLVGAARGPTLLQWACLASVILGAGAGAALYRQAALIWAHAMFAAAFGFSAIWKITAATISRPPEAPLFPPGRALPSYTVIAALYHEGPVVADLVMALQRLDYPGRLLQIVLVLEDDDDETLSALAWLNLPGQVVVMIKREGGPKTKPNALNAALALATGQLIVVYDAEDRPDPGQLREAAARFAADPSLAYLQAPLRITNGPESFLTRQFALEYAGQFEVVVPALLRLGASFPLGGTSNHFRTPILRAAGGWDAFNVTEDADLGFRLAGRGLKGGVITCPTFEDAPETMDDWLPQRTRWIKGYLQTWGVHTRGLTLKRLPVVLSMQLSIGLGILGAAFHGPFVMLLGASALLDVCQGHWPSFPPGDVVLLIVAWAAAAVVKGKGARRAGLTMRPFDALAAPLYWMLQSAAFLFAVAQLVNSPYHWDKTPHRPRGGADVSTI